MRGFIDEIRAAVSGLARAPAFTALAVGVLGLGLGAVIFMYGVADTLMLKPPPFPNANRLYTIATIDGQIAGDYDDSMFPRDYLRIREAQTQFEAMGSIYVGTTYLTGDGQAESLTADSGYFWFFDDANVELVIKVIDGCGFNDRYWVFAGGLTNVETHLTVRDTLHSAAVFQRTNPLNQAFAPILSIDAFDTCP